MTTAADRIQKAVAKRRTSLAAVARAANLPAGWVRSVATGHIARPDPVRLAAIADVLALDYRELLALTDQLGAAEAVSASGDLSALVARLDRQAEVIDRLAAAVELLATGQGEMLRGFLEGLAELRQAPAADRADASHAGTRA